MAFTHADVPDLTGKVVVITGANSGLGLETTRVLAGAGAHVVMAARTREKYDAAAETLGELADQTSYLQLDLADLAQVRSAAGVVTSQHPVIDILINNAGVMLPPESRTKDGFELQLGTNHLGHFAFTGLVLASLIAADEGRIVTVSSGAHHNGELDFDDLDVHTRSYSSWREYGTSKLANLIFAFELQRRLDDAAVAVRSVAAHPGYTATNLQSAGVRMSGAGIKERIADALMVVANRVVATNVADGALPQIHAAVSDVAGATYWGPTGWQEARGPVGTANVNPKAADTEAARKLWDASVERTGVDFAVLTPA